MEDGSQHLFFAAGKTPQQVFGGFAVAGATFAAGEAVVEHLALEETGKTQESTPLLDQDAGLEQGLDHLFGQAFEVHAANHAAVDAGQAGFREQGDELVEIETGTEHGGQLEQPAVRCGQAVEVAFDRFFDRLRQSISRKQGARAAEGPGAVGAAAQLGSVAPGADQLADKKGIAFAGLEEFFDQVDRRFVDAELVTHQASEFFAFEGFEPQAGAAGIFAPMG